MTENDETPPVAEPTATSLDADDRQYRGLSAATRDRIGFLQGAGTILATVYTATGSLVVIVVMAVVAVAVFCSPRIGRH